MMNDYNNNNNNFGIPEQPINNSQNNFGPQQVTNNGPMGFGVPEQQINNAPNNIQQERVPQAQTTPQFVSQSIQQQVSNHQPNYSQQPNFNQNNEQIQQPVYNQQPVVNEQKTPNKKGKNIIIIAIVIIVIIGIAFGVIKFLGKNKSEKGIETLFNIDTPIKIEKNNKYGFVDTKGNVIVEPKYYKMSEFRGDYVQVTLSNDDPDFYNNRYQVIDKKGNTVFSTNDSDNIFYDSSYKIWVLNGQLYDGSLTKISAEDIEVEYAKLGFLIWNNKNQKKAGIMNSSGKVTYTYNYQDGEKQFFANPAIVDASLKDRYCVVNVDNKKYSIVNCNNGAVIYDFTDYQIVSSDNNIFRVQTKNDYELITKMYISNDKIIYQTDNDRIYLSYLTSLGVVRIEDKTDNSYYSKYSYIDISTGEISENMPTTIIDNPILNKWEDYTKITKFSCGNKYGLMKENNIIVPCQYSSIQYFDVAIYKYLSSIGKEYVLVDDDSKSYLINVKNGSVVETFNNKYVYINDGGPFIYYRDYDTNTTMIYSAINNKSITTDVSNHEVFYSNYLYIKEKGNIYYYNVYLDLIYTSEY